MENQKENLKGIIFDKLEKDSSSVDMNIVQVINEDMNVDIMSEIKNAKDLRNKESERIKTIIKIWKTFFYRVRKNLVFMLIVFFYFH